MGFTLRILQVTQPVFTLGLLARTRFATVTWPSRQLAVDPPLRDPTESVDNVARRSGRIWTFAGFMGSRLAGNSDRKAYKTASYSKLQSSVVLLRLGQLSLRSAVNWSKRETWSAGLAELLTSYVIFDNVSALYCREGSSTMVRDMI